MAWHFIFSHPTLFFCATKLFVSIEFVLFFLKTPFLFYHRWIGLCSHHVRQLKSSLRYQSVGLLSGRNKTPHSAVGVVNFSPFEAPHSECRRPGRCGLNWRSTCCLTFLLFIVFFFSFLFLFFLVSVSELYCWTLTDLLPSPFSRWVLEQIVFLPASNGS